MRSAWAAMVVAAVLLLPFLRTPFTIDDPLYLREAQHVLTDPLHPQSFSIVWSAYQNLRASQILPGGQAVPYLLAPVAWAGSSEWAGHLMQLVMLLAALYATALAALRLGLDETQTRWAALLTATCPAVLGMAGTVMPDIAAMLFVTLGMERVIAWREDRRWHQCVAATLWLSVAALTRSHTIVVLAAAFVLLLDGRSFRSFPARFLPVVLTPVVFVLVSWMTADAEAEGNNIFTWLMENPNGFHTIVRNCLAFLGNLLLVVPLTIPWLVLRGRQLSRTVVLIVLVGAGVVSTRFGWPAFVAAATFVVLFDIVSDAVRRRDRVQLALWLWLFLALPVVVYMHLPSKYLLPSVPAVALLVVRRQEGVRWLVPVTAGVGAVLGLLILLGVRDLAQTQRRAVADLIVPHTKIFERVWFAGHWGFHWYAEAAGAMPYTMSPPLPQAGDYIVVSQIDCPLHMPPEGATWKLVQRVAYRNGFGRVMDPRADAGFFSSIYGMLPWVPGSGTANSFEVWKAE